MEELLSLLKDGNTRTTEQLAAALRTSAADIRRKLDFLEHIGAIRRLGGQKHCCSGCSGGACKGCMPENAAQNMGEMWEVVKR